MTDPADRFHGRHGFHSEFTAETGRIIPICFDRKHAVPDIPQMGIPADMPFAEILRSFIDVPGRGGSGPVGRNAVEFVHPVSQSQIEEILVGFQQSFITADRVKGVDLVVSAPECETGAVTDPSDIVLYLFTDILKKVRPVERIERTGKDEVLPYQNPVLVAHIVEIFRFIHAAAPDTQHIHAAVTGRFDIEFHIFPTEPGNE